MPACRLKVYQETLLQLCFICLFYLWEYFSGYFVPREYLTKSTCPNSRLTSQSASFVYPRRFRPSAASEAVIARSSGVRGISPMISVSRAPSMACGVDHR